MQATIPTSPDADLKTALATQAPALPSPAPKTPALQAPARNIAIDTYRGLVMLLMMAEVVQLSRVAQALPGNAFWAFLAYHQTHVAWAGCSLHDTIQPGFSFLVGVALPYSIARRLAKGGTFGAMFAHALWRSLLLVVLGIFLRSMNSTQTYFTFEDTLTQIGLGYPILFLLGFRSWRWVWISLGAILFGYWLAWAVYPAQGQEWFAHWAKNSNLGHAFDLWFLNLFPRSAPFVGNTGGYLTLSFIPTLGTMILGLVAGRWLRDAARDAAQTSPGNAAPVSDQPSGRTIPMKRLLAAGAIGVASGLLLHFAGICPIVKRIWTPAWTLFSGGLCFLFLAGFCWLIEVKGYRKWSFPLVVIGMNSIAAYLMAHLFERFIIDSLRIHLGAHAFAFFGTPFEPLMRGIAVLLVYWLMLYWMYRRKLFLRI